MWTYGVDGVDDMDGVDGVDDVYGVDSVSQGDRRRRRCHAHWTLPFLCIFYVGVQGVVVCRQFLLCFIVSSRLLCMRYTLFRRTLGWSVGSVELRHHRRFLPFRFVIIFSYCTLLFQRTVSSLSASTTAYLVEPHANITDTRASRMLEGGAVSCS